MRNVRITRTNQVWAADITYLTMARGFLYLVAVMDWYSRYVLAWRLSNTLEAGFCAEALEEALRNYLKTGRLHLERFFWLPVHPHPNLPPSRGKGLLR